MKKYINASESYNLPDLDNNGLLDLIDYLGFVKIKDWMYGCRIGNDLILCDGESFVCYPGQADNADSIIHKIFQDYDSELLTPFDRDSIKNESYYYRFDSLDNLIR